MKTINFNGQQQPSWLWLTKVPLDIMPPRAGRYSQIPGRAGAHEHGQDFGPRPLPYEVSILADNPDDLEAKVEELAAWLYTEKPAPLTQSNKPGRTYYASFTDSSELASIADVGEGTITFMAADPLKYGPLIPVNVAASLQDIDYKGSYKGFPLVRITPQGNTSFISYAKDGQTVLIGDPANAINETIAEKLSRLLEDNLTTTSGWTTGSTFIDGGAIVGQITPENGYFTSYDYGTGTDWHGPALKRSVSEAIQDFRVEAIIDFETNEKALGRAEIYLMDVNNALIGKMALKDIWSNAKKGYLEMRAGNLTSGNYFYSGEGKRPGYFNDFYGMLRIERRGSYWFGYVAKIVKGRHTDPMFFKLEDKANKYIAKLAQVEIHLGAAGTNEALPKNRIHKLNVDKINNLADSQKGIIAKAGDVVEVEHDYKKVFINGELRNDLLVATSKLFALDPGVNRINFHQESNQDIVVEYRERFL
jgi:predicted phage tail component-like protein